MNDLHEAARQYLALGLSVIALSGKAPNGKVHPHGIKDALSYAKLVREAGNGAAMGVIHPSYFAPFTHPDTTGIGILTEPPYFVVDIDGEEGAEAWLEIVGEADYLPTDWVSKTSRGLHLWYADTKPRASRRLGNKLDFKAVGGYVAAPPSLHPDGHRYWWMRWPSEGAVMEAPQALIDLLDRGDLERERAMVSRVDNKPIRHVQFEGGKWWATWGFDGVYAAVRDAGEGNRNRLLYWAAFTLVEDGATDEDFDDLNQAALDAGLTARETRLTIRSARRAAGDD